jgi:hypothetical protein
VVEHFRFFAFWLMLHFISLLVNYPFLSPEAFETIFYVILVLLPVIIVESIVGGYLGSHLSKMVASK